MLADVLDKRSRDRGTGSEVPGAQRLQVRACTIRMELVIIIPYQHHAGNPKRAEGKGRAAGAKRAKSSISVSALHSC